MNKKNFRILILIIIDALIVGFSDIAALALRFDLIYIPQDYMMIVTHFIPLDIVIMIGVLAAFKMYNRVWSYASIEEVFSAIKSATVIEVIFIFYHVMLQASVPRSYYIYNWIVLLMLIIASRLSLRAFKAIKRGRKKEISKRIMIIGAGAAASLLIQEIRGAMRTSKVVCIVDDNLNKKGKYIHGIKIVGDRGDIVKFYKKYEVDEIIIAIPSANPKVIKELIEICSTTRAKIKILPSISVSLTESLSNNLREVNYEDLLGRDSVLIENPQLEALVCDKVVMVTGGGGTIGSELCRQLARNKVKQLLIVDIYENGAYELQMELKREYPHADIHVLIASVRDYDRMESIFEQYRPQIIYHAAAHKHVPLMESSPNEAIKNNCKGTLNLVKLAKQYHAVKFVLISTDKAVRPTNVMGATKRICEMIVQAYSRDAETEFVAVRFGNVLGSNGSVIPLFLKQIEAGGPVTLTHKDITRFFMTISEAVSLVLQAGIMAKGGEIFVLDMGEPVKIYDLAKNLIRMKGYIPEEDIKIEIVGLRPGEKLYEELLMEEEGLTATQNNLIYIGKPIEMDKNLFFEKLDHIIKLSETNCPNIKDELAQVCSTYRITENK